MVTGMFNICLILHSLSSKYFTESFGAFFTLNFPYSNESPICVFVGNFINKNRVLMLWKGYHNVIHFNIISNVYIGMYPVCY